jgi:hypothetical protein
MAKPTPEEMARLEEVKIEGIKLADTLLDICKTLAGSDVKVLTIVMYKVPVEPDVLEVHCHSSDQGMLPIFTSALIQQTMNTRIKPASGVH